MTPFSRRSVLLTFLLMGMGVPGQAQPATPSVEEVALTVEDLDRAVPFYRDALSFAPVDTTTLSGPSVGRLVGVLGPQARITALRPPGGDIGIERLSMPVTPVQRWNVQC
ncbi:MAG: VOC family protein [Salinibacter sp.]|uniref:VOC family protein n=1 Tax=Salinibacter sp. TaxID=2065818 RepID=UPI002FC28CED